MRILRGGGYPSTGLPELGHQGERIAPRQCTGEAHWGDVAVDPVDDRVDRPAVPLGGKAVGLALRQGPEAPGAGAGRRPVPLRVQVGRQPPGLDAARLQVGVELLVGDEPGRRHPRQDRPRRPQRQDGQAQDAKAVGTAHPQCPRDRVGRVLDDPAPRDLPLGHGGSLAPDRGRRGGFEGDFWQRPVLG